MKYLTIISETGTTYFCVLFKVLLDILLPYTKQKSKKEINLVFAHTFRFYWKDNSEISCMTSLHGNAILDLS